MNVESLMNDLILTDLYYLCLNFYVTDGESWSSWTRREATWKCIAQKFKKGCKDRTIKVDMTRRYFALSRRKTHTW